MRRAEIVEADEFLIHRASHRSKRMQGFGKALPGCHGGLSANVSTGRALYRVRRASDDVWQFMIVPASLLPSEARALCGRHAGGISAFEFVSFNRLSG
jgi:hypothetical protein